jgi:spore coat polysaccharide biosynthesis protein SpsF (cytidylyltransferase family)
MLVSVVLQRDGTQADQASVQILSRAEGAATADQTRDIQLGANSKTPELAGVVREIEELADGLVRSGPAKEFFDEPGTTPESGKHRRVGALICARVKSARMPGKALVEIAGVEAITLLIERLKTSAACGQIVLCTTTAVEDQALAAIGEREKIGVFRGSSSNVAGRLLGAVRQFGLDDFVRVTGDDPLRCVDLIDLAVESHLRHGADYTHMTGVFLGGDSEVVSARAVETVAERAVKSENTEYLSWYLDDRTVFAVNRMTVDAKYWRPYRLTLDTSEDLEVMRAVYDALYEPGKIVDSLEALEWLDRNEEIARINRDIRSPVDRRDLNLDLNL